VFGGVKVEEALVLCERAGAVAVRVRNARDLVADPVLMEAELAHRIERPTATCTTRRAAWRFSAAPCGAPGAPAGRR
jgi:crotonobetainyl-CoA:carnitine CoA-transferase CaiB-like acyl-CoA transferase